MEFAQFKKQAGIALLGTAFLLSGSDSQAALLASDIYPADLRCEYLSNPLGMDLDTPRLYWKVQTDRSKAHGLTQSAYQIQVATQVEMLKEDNPDLWDTGIVKSSETTHIEYQGAPLEYPMSCYWRVRVADQSGGWSDWSQPANWVMGPMDNDDWTASWVGSSEIFEPKKDLFEPNMANPWIRNTYELPAIPDSAFLYVASVGYHEVYINGVKVGDEVLVPNVSNLKIGHTRYKTYDIVPYLKKGKNAIVFWLGIGWAGFPEFNVPERPRTPMVMAQADITFDKNCKTNAVILINENGRSVMNETYIGTGDERVPVKPAIGTFGGTVQVYNKMRWVTDETWKTHPSPNYTLGGWIWHRFGGDLYDATKELPDWCSPALDDSNWEKVTIYEPKMKVTAEKLAGSVLLEPAITPVRVETLSDGVVKVDMGQNFAGWTEIKLRAKPGTKINMTWSEREEARQSFGLCSAYIMGPEGKGTFRHHFNYGSGRWIYITGLDYTPLPDDIKGHVVMNNLPKIGSFSCDNPVLSDIYEMACRTLESLTLGGYTVDCPQRERLGYGGDGNATINFTMGNYDSAAFYTKWAEDWRSIQTPDGRLLHTAPTYIGGGGPSWSGFIICLPWEVYLQYGDKRILSQTYPNMKKWLEFLEANSKDNLIVPWGEFWDKLGDWLPPGTTGGGTPEENMCMNDCYWVYNLNLAADIASILGFEEDAQKYRQRSQEVRNAVNAKWYNPEKGTYGSGRQAYQAMAILANVPADEKALKATWAHLENDLKTRKHIDAGITGGAFLFRVLMNAGRQDLIYPMVDRKAYPSWGDMIYNRGATTFYENWDDSPGHSHLHSSYLYVGNWFIEGLGGISSFDTPIHTADFLIAPPYLPELRLSEVKSSYDSLRGKVISNWEIDKDRKTMTSEVTIPPNCRALMRFPVALDKVTESGKTLSRAKGISFPGMNPNEVYLQSGSYKFKIKLEK